MRLRKAASDAALEIGAGGGAVRPIIGNLELHDRLEKTIADFKHVESVMVFSVWLHRQRRNHPDDSRHKDDAILTDALNHASIIDGCRLASVPKERRKIYAHCDMESLETALKETQDAKKRLIITEWRVLDGRRRRPARRDLRAGRALRRRRDGGRCTRFRRDGRERGAGRRTISASTRRSISSSGRSPRQSAWSAGTSREVRRSSISSSSAHDRFFFPLAVHPPSRAACIAGIDVMASDPTLTERLWANARYWQAGLQKLGFDTGITQTPITPVMIGDEAKAQEAQRLLRAEGILALAIVFPTVPRGKARPANDADRRPHSGGLRRSPGGV